MAFTVAGNAPDSMVVVVVRVLLLTGIFVDTVLGVRLDVVVLGLGAVDDEAEGLPDAVGRVARVAVRGGMRWKLSASRVFGSIW